MDERSQPKFNVLYVAPSIPIPHLSGFLGGATHVLGLSKALARLGCNVLIISRGVPGYPRFEKISQGIWTFRIPRGLIPILDELIWRYRSGMKKPSRRSKFLEWIYCLFYRIVVIGYLIPIIVRIGFDLVLERGDSKGIGMIPARILGIPSITEIIGPDYSLIGLALSDKLMGYVDWIVPNQLRSKLELVPAGVDLEIYRFDPRERERIRDIYGLRGRKLVVYLGELSRWHGAWVLIKIAKLVEDVWFMMVGESLKQLQSLAQREGVAHRFIWVGHVPQSQVYKYISAADVGIAPYMIDPESMHSTKFCYFPLKILEYMACGIPVLASDLEVIRDLILENECGLLAKPGDEMDFAAKLIKLLEDPELAARLGLNGLRACSKYSWDRIAKRILRIIEPRL